MSEHEEQNVLTWNRYLNDLIKQMSAAQKQLLYEAVGVSRTAFQRWRNGDHLPDAPHIQPLLQALDPEPRARLLELMLEDPKMRVLLPTEIVRPRLPSLADGIESSFYAELFRLQRETPDPFWQLCGAILQHALAHLETPPQPVGLHLVVAQCMPAREQGFVRSLRSRMAIGSRPWRGDLHQEDLFLGMESPAGQAVMTRHGVMEPDMQRSPSFEPSTSFVHSAAAYPIVRRSTIAGALIIECKEPDFFTPERLTYIERCTDLIRLAFADSDFIPTAQIALAVMTFPEQQQPVLATVRKRVEEAYQKTLAEDGSLQGLARVEQQVWQELERELMI